MRNVLGWLVVLLGLSVPGLAQGEESAADIARKSRERGSLNLVGLTAEMKLTTEGKSGKKEQVIRSSSKKIGERVYSVARFLQPATVAGVSLLTIEGEGSAADEISIYLPNLKRVRKVAASQRGQSFQGTDFNYADLGGGGGMDDEKLQRLEDQKMDGREVFVISGAPGAESPYGKVTLWVDKQTFVPLQVDYEDREGKPLKRYKTLKLKKFEDRTLASDSLMENLQTGSKTTLSVLRLEKSELGDEAFTERALERG